MLDIKLIREKPELIKASQKKRGFPVDDVDKLVRLDKEWRDLKEEVDKLRGRRNRLSEEINHAKKQGKNTDGLIKEAREIPKKLEDKEKSIKEIEEKRDYSWKEIPNIIDKSVPAGDASKNKVLKVYGKPIKFKFKPKDHADLLIDLKLLDTQKASEVSGARFYYLKGEIVKLNQAIINFSLDFLKKKNFTLIQPPFMLRKKVLEGAMPFGTFEGAIYKIEGEDLYLIGTAEHALNAYYMDEILSAEKLPTRLAGISSCFRKEAGTHGRDEKGIFRIHQFEKVEQFIFCKPQDSWKEFDFILKNTIEMFKQIGIPFRVVVLAAGDTGRVQTKTVDLEGWFPVQKAYRELASCSNCLDYQARRSNIKYQEGNELKLVHTLNNTAIATERMIACLVENFQQKDGSIKIPKALWKYTGFKTIAPVKIKARKKKSKIKNRKRKN